LRLPLTVDVDLNLNRNATIDFAFDDAAEWQLPRADP